ncbi:MAG: hypothetical protein E6Q62_06340 [Nitrosomonas sp.]|nr:MAG: hypothetical protein E6Q62_06340 [Nitrosomonas sp.]
MSCRAHTIALAAVYRRSVCLVHSLSVAGLLLFCSVIAQANNSCNINDPLINFATHAVSGIGGTGITAQDSGIGGTGINDGGMGGTGTEEESIGTIKNTINDSGIGGTGIIGTITGFSSICVNHVEIQYDSDTPISINGRLSTISGLTVGQVIAVQADELDGVFIARNIAVNNTIAGPISDLKPEARQMRVLGQTIKIGQLPDDGSLSNLKTDHWVQVSGLRLADGTIVATHIESIPPAAEVTINGYVNHVDSSGFEINGTRIDYDVKSLSAELTQGSEVRIEGNWDGAYLKAQYIEIEPTRQSLGNVEHLIIEGYIHALSDNELNLNNWIVTLTPNIQMEAGNTSSGLRLNQRIQVSGRVDENQRVIAERIKVMKYESPYHPQESNGKNQIDDSETSKIGNLEDNQEVKPVQENEDDSIKDAGQDTDQGQSSGIPIEILILAVIIISALVLVLILLTQSCANRKRI